MEKREVEERLKIYVSDEQFNEALKYAGRKQRYIYESTNNPVVMQNWYLVELTVEYIRSMIFSHLTMDLCRTLRNMEKEHSANARAPLQDSHIVTRSVL